jgi:hypothetical protein
MVDCENRIGHAATDAATYAKRTSWQPKPAFTRAVSYPTSIRRSFHTPLTQRYLRGLSETAERRFVATKAGDALRTSGEEKIKTV